MFDSLGSVPSGAIMADMAHTFRGTCLTGDGLIIEQVLMQGYPHFGNHGEPGMTLTRDCGTCGAPVALRWDEEASAR